MKNQWNFPIKVYKWSGLALAGVLLLACSSGTHNNTGRVATQNQQVMTTATGPAENDQEWRKMAERMVSRQIATRGVRDKKVLDVMKRTPRHLFVPEDLIEYAYDDGPLEIGEGQTISQPFIVALMTALLELTGSEKVLEIGTGSGYQAAVLSQLVDSCYSVELLQSLADSAGTRLRRLGYRNVVTKCGDGYQGWAEHAPFDAIIVTAAPVQIPEKIVEQLKPGGRMVLPVGKYYQELILITKHEGGINQKRIIAVRFVPMVKPDGQ